MTRRTNRLAPGLLLAAIAAATTWSAMNAWRTLTVAPGDFLNPLLLLAVVIAVSGALTRWWRWPAAAVLGFQAVVSLALARVNVLNLENAFDKQYYTSLWNSGFGSYNAVIGTPRTVGITGRYEF